MQKEAMEFLDCVMSRGNGVFICYSTPGGVRGFNMPGATEKYIREDKAAHDGFKIALDEGWVKQSGNQNNYYVITEEGKRAVKMYQGLNQRMSSLESSDLLSSLIQVVSSRHPTITSNMNRKTFVIESLETVSDIEEKCKLALEILSSTDTLELTKGILAQNIKLANLTKHLVKQNTKLAQYTFWLVIATFIMAITAAVPIVRESVNWMTKQIKAFSIITGKAGQIQGKVGLPPNVKIESHAILQPLQIRNKPDVFTEMNHSKMGEKFQQTHTLLHKTDGSIK